MVFLALAENGIQLVPDGTLFLHVGIILLMVAVLNATLFKPINRILEERERRTRGGSNEAREMLKRVEESMTRYENSLRAARLEGYQLMEQKRAAAMRERQEKLNALKDEVGRTVELEKAALSTQVEEARGTLRQDARRIASEIATQVLNRAASV